MRIARTPVAVLERNVWGATECARVFGEKAN